MSRRYEVPADFQESQATLRMQTDATDTSTELWLFQLPHEVRLSFHIAAYGLCECPCHLETCSNCLPGLQLDPTEGLTWQLSSTADGVVSGTCQDSEGRHQVKDKCWGESTSLGHALR